jgi:hypothetical protein
MFNSLNIREKCISNKSYEEKQVNLEKLELKILFSLKGFKLGIKACELSFN